MRCGEALREAAFHDAQQVPARQGPSGSARPGRCCRGGVGRGWQPPFLFSRPCVGRRDATGGIPPLRGRVPPRCAAPGPGRPAEPPPVLGRAGTGRGGGGASEGAAPAAAPAPARFCEAVCHRPGERLPRGLGASQLAESAAGSPCRFDGGGGGGKRR